MKNYRENLHKITTFIFDFDGVISDGKVYAMADGEQVRTSNVKDGYAMHYALERGYRIAIISGGYAESMKSRFRAYANMEIYLKVRDKVAVFNEYMAKHSLSPEEVVYMGDDIPDYKLMQLAGIKTCPLDACEEIKSIVDYISFQKGGEGCVRDIIEQTLKAQGRWFDDQACIW